MWVLRGKLRTETLMAAASLENKLIFYRDDLMHALTKSMVWPHSSQTTLPAITTTTSAAATQINTCSMFIVRESTTMFFFAAVRMRLQPTNVADQVRCLSSIVIWINLVGFTTFRTTYFISLLSKRVHSPHSRTPVWQAARRPSHAPFDANCECQFEEETKWHESKNEIWNCQIKLFVRWK